MTGNHTILRGNRLQFSCVRQATLERRDTNHLKLFLSLCPQAALDACLRRHPSIWRSAFIGQPLHHLLDPDLLHMLHCARGSLPFSPSPQCPALEPLLHCAARVLLPKEVLQLARELDLSLSERDRHGNTLLHVAITGPCQCASHVASLSISSRTISNICAGKTHTVSCWLTVNAVIFRFTLQPVSIRMHATRTETPRRISPPPMWYTSFRMCVCVCVCVCTYV